MSRSKTSICNLAISWLSGNQLTDIDVDDSREAQSCRANYDESRQLLLSDGDYSFARKLYELPKASDSPEFGYSAKFLIPAQVLVVRDASPDRGDYGLNSYWSSRNDDFQWIIREGYIHANAETLYIQATYDLMDEKSFSPAFTHMLAAHIAMNIAVPVTESGTVETRMATKYTNYRQQALGIDGIQRLPRRITSNSLLRVR